MFWFFVVLWSIIVLSFLKDLLAWLQIFQHKEYRWAKYKEYLFSIQGKNALTNSKQKIRLLQFLVLLPLSLFWVEGIWLSFLVFAVTCLWGLIELVNVVLGYKRGFSLPVPTKRLLVTLCVSLVVFVGGWWVLGHFFLGLVLSSVVFLLLLPFLVGCLSYIFSPLDRYLTKRLTQQAQVHYGKLGVDTIAISGSYGKSTIKNFLHIILGSSYATQRTSGNINTVKGIAHFLLTDVVSDTDFFICEMGGDTPGEIATIGQMVTPHQGFLTGLNNQHAGLYGGLQGAIDAECEILDQLALVGGRLYLNKDSDYIDSLSFPGPITVFTYSIKDPKADAYTRIVAFDQGVWHCQFISQETVIDFSTDVVGRHNILNLTGVISCCLHMGLAETIIVERVANLRRYQKTMLSYVVDDCLVIDDSYNINIDGVKAACRLLADSEEYTHKVLVVNEINELGNEALSTHRILGEVLSQSVATSIFLTGKNYSGEIIQGLGTTDIDIVDCHAVGPEKSFDMLQKLTRTNSLIVFLGREQGSMKFLKRLVN